MFTSQHTVIVLDCQHIFHQTCVEDAVAHQHVRCPLCRAVIPTHEKKKEERNPDGHLIRFPE